MKITQIYPLDSREITLPDDHPYWDVPNYNPKDRLPYAPLSLAHVFRHNNPNKWALLPGETWQTELDTPTNRRMAFVRQPSDPISLGVLRGKAAFFKVRAKWYKYEKRRGFFSVYSPRPGYESFYLYIEVKDAISGEVLHVTESTDKSSRGRNMIYVPYIDKGRYLAIDSQGQHMIHKRGNSFGRVDLHLERRGYCHLPFFVSTTLSSGENIVVKVTFNLTVDSTTGVGEWTD